MFPVAAQAKVQALARFCSAITIVGVIALMPVVCVPHDHGPGIVLMNFPKTPLLLELFRDAEVRRQIIKVRAIYCSRIEERRIFPSVVQVKGQRDPLLFERVLANGGLRFCLGAESAGIKRLARIAMMAITTRSSMSVKPVIATL